MDNYIVSARKYRPATFRTVVGQSLITNTLKNAIRNQHVAQAYLFCGPRGVGKTTCARILAKTINCMNLTDDIEPCNECESCKGFNENASFNIHELDAASNNSVEDIRALTDQVRFSPQVGKYSIYIIDEVHMLSSSAFNAFLKTLEEPPPHAIFILATTERHKILPTILSRCQVFTFNRIGVDDIAQHLSWVAEQESVKAEPEALHIIAQKADGGLRDALSMFDQIISYSGEPLLTYQKTIENLNVLDYEVYFKLTDILWQGKYHDALMVFDEVLARGFDSANFLSGMADHLRNLLVCQDGVTLSLLETSNDIRSKYQTQAANWKPIHLIKSLDLISSFEEKLKTTRNQRLQVELLLLRISQIVSPLPEEIKKKDSEPEVRQQSIVQKSPEVSRPEPQAQKQVPTMSFKGLNKLKTVSIKGTKNLEEQEDKESLVEESKAIIEDLPEESFDEQDMILVWNRYSDELLKKGKNALSATLTLTKPKLKEGCEIHYMVQNESQLNELELAKTDLLSFVRKNLKNFSVKLVLEKAEAPIKTKPYTMEEKLKAIEEINPNVTKLKERLGLIPD